LIHNYDAEKIVMEHFSLVIKKKHNIQKTRQQLQKIIMHLLSFLWTLY